MAFPRIVASGSLIGPVGQTGNDGADGLPGVNAIENDAAVAAYLESDASATYAALKARGAGELAYAQNATNVDLDLTATANDVPDCVVVVEATDRNVWINWFAGITVSFGGQGAVIGQIYETTGGVPVSRGATKNHYLTSQPATGNADPNIGAVRVGPADHTRIFVLYGWVVQEGSSLTASFQNLASVSTWIQAVAL